MKTQTVKKVTLDTSYSGKLSKKRFEMRCSENFLTVLDALVKNNSGEYRYSKKTRADMVIKAVKELAIKEGLFKAGDVISFE